MHILQNVSPVSKRSSEVTRYSFKGILCLKIFHTGSKFAENVHQLEKTMAGMRNYCFGSVWRSRTGVKDENSWTIGLRSLLLVWNWGTALTWGRFHFICDRSVWPLTCSGPDSAAALAHVLKWAEFIGSAHFMEKPSGPGLMVNELFQAMTRESLP